MTFNNLEQQYNILSLLPYTECAQLINKKQKLDDLYFIKSVVSFSIKGLEHFIQGDLTEFDAQVGENLCQIRAYQISYIWKNISSSLHSKNEFINKIDLLKSYLYKLNEVISAWEIAIKNSSSYNKSLDKTEDISSFLERNNLSKKLDDETVFIIACFFLSYFCIREEGLPVAINIDLMHKDLNISKYKATKLTHKYQVIVCEIGCNFITKISQDLSLYSSTNYFEILPKIAQISDGNRRVLPCYIVSEIIFNHSIKEQIPILLRVTRKEKAFKEIKDIIYFILVGNNERNYFSLQPYEKCLLNYCMVVYGEVECDLLEHPKEYVINFMEKNPLKLILANTAMHPQYSGNKLYEYRDDPFLLIEHDELTTNIDVTFHKKNLNDMKEFAIETGCSKENPSVFFLKHVYANQVAKEINGLKQNGLLFEAYKMLHHEELVY